MTTIQLLRKADLLIDELVRKPSTPAELARGLNEPRSSVYRIAASLEEAGYIRQTGDGRLEPGATLLRLGDSAAAALMDRRRLRSRLQWIQEQLATSAFYCVLRDDGALCLDMADGSDVDLLHLLPGKALPLHAGAVSHVLVANGPQEIREKALSQAELERSAPGRTPARRHLETMLAAALAQGWSVDDGELADGIATVAVPVKTGNGELVGAVAVAGLRTNLLARREMAQHVLASVASTIAELRREERAPDAYIRSDHSPAGTAARTPSVIAKASALMSVLEAEGTATSTRLTEALEEPPSSVYRILTSLQDLGWVEQVRPRGAYRVGLKMLSLSEELLRGMDIRRVAAPIMREIHQATGETIFLCIRQGNRAVCIERVDGVRVNSRVLQLGRSLPLHVGAAPRALLAFDSRDAWEEYVNAAESTGDRWPGRLSRVELFRDLEAEREQGFTLVDNEVTPGIAAVGAPVFNHRGEVIASLSASGLREGIINERPEGEFLPGLIRRGARALSTALGSPRVAGPLPVDRHSVYAAYATAPTN